ncbi:MAG: carbon-nitrogen hydrolase family protein [Acidilobus sp.]
MPLKMALLHTRTRLGARRTNVKRLIELVDRIMENKEDGVDLLVLPAYPLTGPIVGYYADQKVPTLLKGFAERISDVDVQMSPTLSTVSRIAEEYGIHVVAGPVVERAGPRLYLTTIAVGPDGRLVGKYRKISLTKKESESGLTPGKGVAVFEVRGRGVKVGLFIDEDINYPEVIRALAYQGADIAVGAMLPFQTEFIRMRSETGTSVLTLDMEQIVELLNVRSRENGLVSALVGGAVEGANGLGLVAFMPTMVAEPDTGVIKDKVMTYDDVDMPMFIEVQRAESRRPKDFLSPILKNLCKAGGRAEEAEEEF